MHAAVLLTAEGRAKIGDVGLARFMPNDYLSTAAATGSHSTRRSPNMQAAYSHHVMVLIKITLYLQQWC